MVTLYVGKLWALVSYMYSDYLDGTHVRMLIAKLRLWRDPVVIDPGSTLDSISSSLLLKILALWENSNEH